ncbi:MAG: ribose-5-phosphate isomerase RpiA [Myxococcota bacterium]|nr:ribose-5-phosphate isomerase RpiA [Myxococcota bacterium]
MSDPVERAKEAAGRHAADYVEDGMRVGLGTGSTVHHTILALGERKPRITCVATSVRTQELATRLGLEVVTPDDLVHLDVAIDGADEVDPDFNLVKGGGGAHTREKVVAAMADRFIVVVDESKLVETLGAFGLPIEALPFAPGVVADRVRALGASELVTRPEPSDNGNVLMDARFAAIDDPAGLAARLSAIPGLVEHGIFVREMVERVVIAGSEGVSERVRDGGG